MHADARYAQVSFLLKYRKMTNFSTAIAPFENDRLVRLAVGQLCLWLTGLASI